MRLNASQIVVHHIKKNKNEKPSLSLALACGIKAVSVFFAWPLAAQNFDNEIIDEIVILGSRVSAQSVLTTPAPVDFLSAEALSDSAHAESGRAIQSLAPSFNFPSTSIADGTDALKPATLRGLGPDQTLVLVNGLRRHKSALVHVNSSVGRGSAGTDMIALPPSFFQSVEILRDGAYTLYGSDAIAGVINLRLRETSDGEVIISYGQTKEGDGGQYRLAINESLELPNNGFLFLGYEFIDREKTNRAGLSGTRLYSPSDPVTCNATDNSGCYMREFTAHRRNMIVGDPESKQDVILLNGGMDFSWGDLRGFVNWSQRDNQSTGFFRQPNDANRNVPEIYPDGFLPQINTDIGDLSGAVSGHFDLSGWKTSLSYIYGENSFDFFINNSLNASFGENSLTRADSGGFEYDEQVLAFDTMGMVGSLNVATGLEWKREGYEIRAGELLSYIHCRQLPGNSETCENSKSGGIQVFPGFRPDNALSRQRNSYAVFAEASKMLGSLMVSGALRLEDYEGFDEVLSGRLSGFFEINSNHALRGTLGNGFRAPSMHQLYFNNVSTQFDNAGIASETLTSRNDSAMARALGVPTLKEENAINVSLGYVFTPASEITLTLDAYQIDIDDRIILSNQVAAVALDSEPQQVFANAGVTKAQFFINGPDTRTRGLDVVGEWSPQISHGTLETKLAWNMTETEVTGRFRLQGLLNGLSQDLLFTERDRDIIEAWQPEERLTLSANWKLNMFTVQGDVNRYGSYLSSEGSGSNYVSQNHDAAYIVNVRLHYDVLPSLRLSFWGDNITDQYPEKNTISAARSGTIKGIVDSPNGVFQYSRRTAPYGFNGAFWGMSVKHSF